MSELFRIESIGQIHEFLGLDKPKHPLVSVVYPHRQEPKKKISGMKIVSELYSISFKSGIEGTLNYGRTTYDFEEGTMVYIAPGQVIEYEGNDPIELENDSWMLVFHPDLIRKAELGKKIGQYSFFNYDSNEALHISDKEKKSMEEIIGKIQDEYDQNIDRHSQELIVANIKLLLDYSLRFFDRQFYTRTNIHQDMVSVFERKLKDYFTSDLLAQNGIPTVSYFGKEMGYSPYYLSDLLKKETGKNIRDHIHHELIEQAKNQLLNSNKSISEIAYDLGFEYPQHLSKIFKNKTGFSPGQYRNSIN